MAKLILIDDRGLTHVLPDVEATLDWESDIVDDDLPARWMTRPRFPRPHSGKTVLAASTRSPMTTISPDASEADRLKALGFGDDMKLVRQEKKIAPADVREGDRIRIEWTYPDGSVLSREETAPRGGYAYLGESEHRSIYLLERAPFKLPTTPGSVVLVETDGDCEGPAEYVLDLGGVWRGGESGSKFHEDYFEDHFDGDPQILVGGDES